MRPARRKSRPYWDQFPVLPLDWSPEQALAVFELLDTLKERLWLYYGCDIQNLLREQISSACDSPSGPSEDPPF